MDLIQRAKAFLIAIEGGLSGDELDEWYAPDAEQIEFPNLYNAKGATRNLDELKAASVAGKKVM